MTTLDSTLKQYDETQAKINATPNLFDALHFARAELHAVYHNLVVDQISGPLGIYVAEQGEWYLAKVSVKPIIGSFFYEESREIVLMTNKYNEESLFYNPNISRHELEAVVKGVSNYSQSNNKREIQVSEAPHYYENKDTLKVNTKHIKDMLLGRTK